MFRQMLTRRSLSVSALAQPASVTKPKTARAQPAPKVAKAAKAAKDAEAASKKKAAAAKKAAAEQKIKSAPSPYNLFVRNTMPQVRSNAAPGEKVTETMGKIASMWKELPEEAKRPLQAQSKELKADVDARKLEAKAEKKRNARPLPPFTAFTSQHYAEFHEKFPELALPDITKKLSEAYKAIPEAQKATILTDYHAQLVAWKAKQLAKAAAA